MFLSFVFFLSPLFFVFSLFHVFCLCGPGFSQLCSPRRAFSEQGPLRLIKSASFFSGWRSKLATTAVCQLHVCVEAVVGSVVVFQDAACMCVDSCITSGGSDNGTQSHNIYDQPGSYSWGCKKKRLLPLKKVLFILKTFWPKHWYQYVILTWLSSRISCKSQEVCTLQTSSFWQGPVKQLYLKAKGSS